MNHYANRRLFGSWYIPDINKPIGIGGFGRVYELRSYDVPDSVTAVKIISIPKNQDEYTQQMGKLGASEQKVQEDFRETKDALINELKMMLKVSGFTNCVSCMAYSVEEHEEGFGWDILIQMEKLESLDSYFRRKGKIYDTDIIQLGIDMCSALEACELNNIVHRDIKPANIMVRNINGKTIYKLGDFGVARTLSKNGVTNDGITPCGTFGYMAPELLMGEGDLRVDIYSLGMVMYTLLNANRFPFYPDYPQVVSSEDAGKAQIKWNRDIPKPDPLYSMGTDLAKVVLKACEYDREKRYRSAAEMRGELQRVLAENSARLIFTVPSIGEYKPSERKLLVKISGKRETAVYDGREHRAEGYTSNADSHNVRVQLAPGSEALAKGTKAGKYMMGLSKESFIVSPGDSRLAVEDVLVQDGMLIIEEAPGGTEGEPPKKPTKWLILACLAAVIIALGSFCFGSARISDGQDKSNTSISSPIHSAQAKADTGTLSPVTATPAGTVHTAGAQEDAAAETGTKEPVKLETPQPTKPQSAKATGFEYKQVNGEITITEYKGNGSSVEIPEEINGMPVRKIGEYAFNRNKTITNVTIPYGVAEIDEHAFHRCEKLESVEIPDSVTKIGKCAFFGCLELTSVSLPEGLEKIEESCFERCESLQSAYIPGTVTEIERYAFMHCYDLASVNIPDGVVAIGKSAFYECNAMDSISVPANAEIGDKAFYGIDEVLFVD